MHVQIHIRSNKNNNHADRKGRQTQEQGFVYIKSTVTTVSIESAEKEQRKQKGGHDYETEHKPHSARNTGRKTGKETRIHKRHGLIETEKECAFGRLRLFW